MHAFLSSQKYFSRLLEGLSKALLWLPFVLFSLEVILDCLNHAEVRALGRPIHE